MPSERITLLVEKYFSHTCTENEINELMQWANVASEEELEAVLEHSWNSYEDRIAMPDEVSQRILTSIFENAETETTGETMPFWQMNYRIAASVAIVALLSLFAWFQYRTVGERTEQRLVQVKEFEKNDVAPGTNKAILTLDDGSEVVLDNSENGTLSKQGSTTIVKPSNGQLLYETAQASNAKPMYNTVKTPKGGQYQVVLSDGTKVWLNAASSLRFPLVFVGNERKVEMTGEVYFEVAKNPKKPFKVIADKQEVLVLGTHFNVMAYPNEKFIKTTLLEGSVKITKDNRSMVLEPNQQAKVGFDNGVFRAVNDADIAEELAWKDGYFQFNNTSLETIMRQLERWYDVDVQYIGKIPDEHFTGRLPRNTNLSNVLKILSMSQIQFKIEGKNIIITP